MACSATINGLYAGCENNMGGIKAIFLGDYTDNKEKMDMDETGDMVAFTTVEHFQPYVTNRNTSTMTSTATIDKSNGVSYFTTELSLTFAKMDTTKRIELSSLMTGEVLAIVVDSNNNGWLLGYDEPVYTSALTAQTGAAKSDPNNYVVTLTDESLQLPYQVIPADVEKLMAKLNA